MLFQNYNLPLLIKVPFLTFIKQPYSQEMWSVGIVLRNL